MHTNARPTTVSRLNIHVRHQRYSAGRTLIELMIGMAIGMFISALVLSLYMNSRASFRLHDENGRMREDGNFAMNLIGRNVIQSGYSPIAATTLTQPIAQATYLNAQTMRGCEHGFVAPTKGDFSCGSDASGQPAIEVVYVVDKSYQSNIGEGADCNGQQAKFNLDGAEFGSDDVRYVINRFFVSKKKGDLFGTLYCAGSGNTTPQPILANVENFKVSFSVDGARDFSADKINNWKKVMVVTMCLQVASENKVIAGSSQKYVDCSGAESLSKDGRLRSVFQGAFALRNNVSPTL